MANNTNGNRGDTLIIEDEDKRDLMVELAILAWQNGKSVAKDLVHVNNCMDILGILDKMDFKLEINKWISDILRFQERVFEDKLLIQMNLDQLEELARFLFVVHEEGARIKALLALYKIMSTITSNQLEKMGCKSIEELETIGRVWIEIHFFPDLSMNLINGEEPDKIGPGCAKFSQSQKAGLTMILWQYGTIAVIDVINKWIKKVNKIDPYSVKCTAKWWLNNVCFLKEYIEAILSIDISMMCPEKIMDLATFVAAIDEATGRSEALHLLEKTALQKEEKECAKFRAMGEICVDVCCPDLNKNEKLDQSEELAIIKPAFDIDITGELVAKKQNK